MKALVLKEKDKLPVLEDRVLGRLSKGCARIRIHASALNRRDVWIMQGKYPGIHYPIILGSDGCGTVVDIDGAQKDLLDKRVVFYPAFDWGDNPNVQSPQFTILGLPRDGTFAEFIDLPVSNLCPAPIHLTDEEAAALPLAGLTAWRALITRGRLQHNERVFITGIGGGVSQMAALFALAKGAHVFVSSHQVSKLQKAKDMGAAGGVDYTTADWVDKARELSEGGFDLIIDGAGGPDFGGLTSLLKPAGRLVYYGGTQGKWPEILPQKLFYRQVDILASTMGSPLEMNAMLEFVAQTKLRPSVAQTFPLAKGAEAFRFLQSSNQYGKVVIKMDADRQ